jgi:two-component system, response regulator PdtaR
MPDKKIFIVEDEPVVAMTLEDTLAQLGYTVAGTATNGNDALVRIGESHPDLILMDIRIQGDIDGIETAEKVTARYNIPIVYLTAHSDDKTLERAMKTQPHGYLLKPFRMRELYSTIEIALYKHRLITQAPVAASTPAPAPRVPAERSTTVTLERAALDAMNVPVFVVNRDMKLMYFNTACEELFSRLGCKQPIPGRLITDIALPQLIGRAKDYSSIFESGHQTTSEISTVIDNNPTSFSLEKIPLLEQGAVSYVVGVMSNTTNESLLDERVRMICAHHELLLTKLGEITSLISGQEDPAMKKISQYVGEIVIAITRLESGWSKHE